MGLSLSTQGILPSPVFDIKWNFVVLGMDLLAQANLGICVLGFP